MKFEAHRALLSDQVEARSGITCRSWSRRSCRADCAATATASREALLGSEQDHPDVRQVGREWRDKGQLMLRLKAHLRRRAVRSFDAPWRAIGDIRDIFQSDECGNFFKAAGYEPT